MHVSTEILDEIVGRLCDWGHAPDSGGIPALLRVVLMARAVSREWRYVLDYRWLGDMVLSVGGAFGTGGLWGAVAGQWMGGRSPMRCVRMLRGPWADPCFTDVHHLLTVMLPYTVSVLLRVRAEALASAASGAPESCPVRHCVRALPLRTLFIIIVVRTAGTSSEGYFLRSLWDHIADGRKAGVVEWTAQCDRIAARVSAHVEVKRARFAEGALGTMGQPGKVQEAVRGCLSSRRTDANIVYGH